MAAITRGAMSVPPPTARTSETGRDQVPAREPDTERAGVARDGQAPPSVAWFENDASRNAARLHAAFNAHDWDAYRALYSDDWSQDDRRSGVAVPLDRDQSFAGLQLIFDGGGRFVARETVATRGRTCAGTCGANR